MLTKEGKVSVPDALLLIQWASASAADGKPLDPISRKDAFGVLQDFTTEHGRGELVGPRGENIEVGPTFLSTALSDNPRSRIIGPDGITRGITWTYFSFIVFLLPFVVSVVVLCAIVFSPWLSQWMDNLEYSRNALSLPPLNKGAVHDLGFYLFMAKFSFGVWLVISVVTVAVTAFIIEPLRFAERYSLPKNLRGLSLVFDRNDLLNFLSGVFDKIDQSSERHRDVIDTESDGPRQASSIASEKRATAFIVSRYTSGDVFTKDDMRTLLTSPQYSDCISRRGFDRAWDAAREHAPSLGKPGRRKSNPRFDTEM